MQPMFRHATLAAVLLSVASTVNAKTASEVYEQAAKSTVVVENIDAKGKAQSMGSGVVLHDGDVVTNCHVVKGADRLKVRIGAKEHPATLRYSDWDRDVCSLTVLGLSAPAVVVGSTKPLKVGDRVYAIGAPKGLALTLSDGIVSSLRQVAGGQYIQTTAAISPGSSGGGLFNESGALVGLTTFYLTEGQNLNFAVPVEWVKELPNRSAKTPAAAQPVTQWLNKGIELENSEDWSALLEHSLRWTQVQSGSDAAWAALGAAYSRVGQSVKAIDAYQAVLRINSEYANAWYNLGIDYAKVGQAAKAIGAYQQALRIDPEYADAWYNLGTVYVKAGQAVKAIDAYQQVLSVNPEYAGAWYNLGNAYADAGQAAKAIEAYKQALLINPEDVRSWYNLGALYADTGQRGKVLDVYKRLKTLDPSQAAIFFKNAVMP